MDGLEHGIRQVAETRRLLVDGHRHPPIMDHCFVLDACLIAILETQDSLLMVENVRPILDFAVAGVPVYTLDFGAICEFRLWLFLSNVLAVHRACPFTQKTHSTRPSRG